MSNTKHLDCIANVRQQIKTADPSLGWIKFKCAGDNGITGQPIVYSQEIKKKDGTIKHVQKESFVSHAYCPFCGKQYK